jgi:hypothetical protein
MKALKERLNILKEKVKNFFFPPAGSPRWRYILPFAGLSVVLLVALSAGAYGWEYTNSPQFCGSSCHTMPPQDVTYQVSPHANVYCTECHIGRAFIGEQLARKVEDVRELYAMVFNTYHFPIRAMRSKPAQITCEQCHKPEVFSGDSLRTITRFGNDDNNTPESIFLILKTGGGAKSDGLGRGIHWHIVNKVSFYATDPLQQNIPFVRVYNDDGTFTDFVDVESGFDPSSIKESDLREMDCTTCHNRVSHEFQYPTDSVDEALGRGIINPNIPSIRRLAVDALSAEYTDMEQAMRGIEGIANYYQSTGYYTENRVEVDKAIEALKIIYGRTVFFDQKVDWTTHPDNIGHINSPGCFRCHGGQHLNEAQEAVRLECNVCHSIPVVAGPQDFVANIEISLGLEPASHLNANWISLHNMAYDATCANCHTVADPGGTSNQSFCSNSACHGSAYPFAGFDAPALREILQAQLPKPTPVAPLAPITGTPTFEANISPLLNAKCSACHGTNAAAGLNVTTYATLLQGGNGGVSILAGDSANSLLVKVQSGTHFATFTAQELDAIKQWIDAGANDD